MWPGSKVIVVDDGGHGGDTTMTHWRRTLADLGEPALTEDQNEPRATRMGAAPIV